MTEAKPWPLTPPRPQFLPPPPFHPSASSLYHILISICSTRVPLSAQRATDRSAHEPSTSGFKLRVIATATSISPSHHIDSGTQGPTRGEGLPSQLASSAREANLPRYDATSRVDSAVDSQPVSQGGVTRLECCSRLGRVTFLGIVSKELPLVHLLDIGIDTDIIIDLPSQSLVSVRSSASRPHTPPPPLKLSRYSLTTAPVQPTQLNYPPTSRSTRGDAGQSLSCTPHPLPLARQHE